LGLDVEVLHGWHLVAYAALVDLDALDADLTRDPPALCHRLCAEPDGFAGHDPLGHDHFLLVQHHLPAIARRRRWCSEVRLVDQLLRLQAQLLAPHRECSGDIVGNHVAFDPDTSCPSVHQQAENHLLQPVIMSRTVQLSALTVTIAILLGVELLGFLGALLAIPVAGILHVIGRDLYDGYRGRLKPEPTIGEDEVPVSTLILPTARTSRRAG
jgi:hypothetical protein